MKNPRAQNGFTLVELAIVLAILGLLAGGIVGGQSLIMRARVNTVITDVGKYRTAYRKFQEVYQAIPGDYVDATEQWGAANGGTIDGYTATCYGGINRTPKKPTCNGNGNNIIVPPESYLVWQHLADAGLIDGTYSGAPDAAGGITPGENAPGGPFENSAYYMDTSNATTGHPNYFDQGRQTTFMFGRRVNGNWPSSPVLTPTDQYSIDIKVDEGTPGNGKIRSLKSPVNPGCATTDDASTAIYDRKQTGQTCLLWIIIGDPVL